MDGVSPNSPLRSRAGPDAEESLPGQGVPVLWRRRRAGACKQESKRGEGGAAGLRGLQLLCRTVPEAKPVGGGCEEP